uniref:Uncharacterized protein n=1 Tax=Anguilla anguilla TaxID=7936 RepID=A0A0E9XGP7_ANGAN
MRAGGGVTAPTGATECSQPITWRLSKPGLRPLTGSANQSRAAPPALTRTPASYTGDQLDQKKNRLLHSIGVSLEKLHMGQLY